MHYSAQYVRNWKQKKGFLCVYRLYSFLILMIFSFGVSWLSLFVFPAAWCSLQFFLYIFACCLFLHKVIEKHAISNVCSQNKFSCGIVQAHESWKDVKHLAPLLLSWVCWSPFKVAYLPPIPQWSGCYRRLHQSLWKWVVGQHRCVARRAEPLAGCR